MPRYNVRCCCQPTKILGTLQVNQSRPGMFYVQEKPEIPVLSDATREIADEPVSHHCLQLVPYRDKPGSYELAVYSEDRDIDFWRRLPTFQEASQ